MIVRRIGIACLACYLLMMSATGLYAQVGEIQNLTAVANQWDIAQCKVTLPAMGAGKWQLTAADITSTHPHLHIGRIEVFENSLMVAQSARFKVTDTATTHQLVFEKVKANSSITALVYVAGGQGQAHWGSLQVSPTSQQPLASMFDTWIAYKTCDVTSTLSETPAVEPFDTQPSPVLAGEIRLEHPTLHAIGLEWDIQQDFNRNSTVTVAYRQVGQSQWQEAQPMLRNLFDQAGTTRIGWHVVCPNRFTGSVLNLEPDTAYQVQLTLSDPDGGSQTQIIEAHTKTPLSRIPHQTVLHVYPSSWDGQRLTPNYDTFEAAYEMVQSGQTIFLHAGVHQFGSLQAKSQRYGDRIAYIHPPVNDADAQLYMDFSPENRQANRVIHLHKQATTTAPIRITGELDGSTILDGGAMGILMDLTGAAAHQIQYLTFRNVETAIYANHAQGIEISDCQFMECRYGINAGPHDHDDLNKQSDDSTSRITGWTMDNNAIIGNWPTGQWQDGWSVYTKTFGYLPLRLSAAIQLGGQGHDIHHNTVKGFWDGISVYPIVMPPLDPTMCNSSIDIYNNAIEQCPDDGIEMDYGTANIRVINNFIANAHMGISMQPLFGGPGYVLRNVVYNTRIFALKIARNPSGLLIYHNTFVVANAARMETGWANTQMANNLFLGNDQTASGPLWTGNPTPLLSRIDYNGYAVTGCQKWFWVTPALDRPVYASGQLVFESFADFQYATGMETHGMAGLSYSMLRQVNEPRTKHLDLPLTLDFQLKTDAPCIDHGQILYNINDDFTGQAPELGALELDSALPTYGRQIRK